MLLSLLDLFTNRTLFTDSVLKKIHKDFDNSLLYFTTVAYRSWYERADRRDREDVERTSSAITDVSKERVCITLWNSLNRLREPITVFHMNKSFFQLFFFFPTNFSSNSFFSSTINQQPYFQLIFYDC